MQITQRTTRTITNEELITIPTQQLFAKFQNDLYASITPIQDPVFGLIYHCITIQLSTQAYLPRHQISIKTLFANSLLSSEFNDHIIEEITKFLLNNGQNLPFTTNISQTEFKVIFHQATKHILEYINHPLKIQ